MISPKHIVQVSNSTKLRSKPDIGFRVNNLVYRASFDGTMFRYKVKKPWRIIFALLGVSTNIYTPLNIMLGLRIHRFLGFEVVWLCQNKFTFGQSEPSPQFLKGMLFLSTKKRIGDKLKEIVDENVLATFEGRNIGLQFLDRSSVYEYYSKLSG